MIKRVISALLGIPLLLVMAFEAYLQSFGFYFDHYTLPMEKYGVRTPLRSEDVAFLAAFWLIAVALFYISYRLLRFAFRREVRGPGSSGGREPAAARTSQ
jgi:hypothetical protein